MQKNRFLLFNLFVITCFLLVFFCTLSATGTAHALQADASYAQVSSTPLETAFSLFDLSKTANPLYTASSGVATADLTPNVGNQKGTNICWTFANNTALETSIYMKAKTDSSFTPDEPLDFSELDVAYTLLKKRGLSATAGGNSGMSLEYLTSEYGPALESAWEKNCIKYSLEVSDADAYAFQQYETLSQSNGVEKSCYAVMDAKFFPARKLMTTSSEIETLRNSIKNHICTYGGVMATIRMNPDTSAPYKYFSANKDTYYLDEDKDQNHMITLVGWNDNYSYQGHTGAYIAQNSYGESFGKNGFFYIMYDSYDVEDCVCGFTGVSYTLQSTRDDSTVTTYSSTKDLTFNGLDYENVFIYYDNGSVYETKMPTSSNFYLCNIFPITDTSATNKIARIKIPCSARFGSTGLGQTQPTTFKVYVLNNLSSNILDSSKISDTLKNAYTSAVQVTDASGQSSFTTQFVGFYTIDLGSNLIELSGDYFAVVFVIENGEIFCINNNESSTVDYHHTFRSYNGQHWTSFDYNYGTQKCIVPMMVETSTQLDDMTYQVANDNIEETYSGTTIYPDITVTQPSNYTIYYSVDAGEWTTVKPGFINVCDHVVSYKIVQTGYKTVTGDIHIKITPRTLTLTPNSGQHKEYKATDPVLTYTLDGLVDGDDPQFYGSIRREEGEAIGEYSIVKGNLLVLNENYTLSFISGVKFSITQRTITIIPDAKESVYGEEFAQLTYHYVGALASEPPPLVVTLKVVLLDAGDQIVVDSQDIKDAGSYDIAPSISISDSDTFDIGNYNVVYDYATCRGLYTITRRSLTVTADNASKVYEESDPTFGYTYSGNLSGETPAFDGSLSRETGEEANVYSITQGSLELKNNGSFKADNYSISFVEGVFTIENAELTGFYSIQDASYVYDGAEHSITIDYDDSLTVKYLVVDNVSSPFVESSATTTLPVFSNVGKYIIKVQFSATNFNSAVAVACLDIVEREIVVTPYDNQSKVYGDADPTFTYDYSGVITGQVPLFSGRLSRATGNNVGEYEITKGTLLLLDNELFKISNYSLTFTTNVKFEITKRTLTVTPRANQGKMYNTADGELEYDIDGRQYQDSLTFVGSLARESGETAGNYAINSGTLALSDDSLANYNYSFSSDVVDFIIRPQPITLEVNNKTCYYGEIDLDFSYTISPSTIDNYKVGDDLNVTYTCKDDNDQDITNTTPRKNSGYVIRATANNPNYTITIHNGKFYIVYRKFPVKFVYFDEELNIEYSHFDKIGNIKNKVQIDKAGYRFEYWQNGSDTYTMEEIASYEVVGETTFEAVYSLVTLHIDYKLNGGYFNPAVDNTFNAESVMDLPTPLYIGHTFDGYYLDSNFTSRKILSINQDFNTNITLYAKWSLKEYNVTFPDENSMYSITQNSEKAVYGKNYSFTVRLNYAYDDSTIRVFRTLDSTAEIFEVSPISRSRLVSTPGNPRGDLVIAYNIESVQDSDFTLSVSGLELNTYTVSFWRFSEDGFYRDVDNLERYKNPSYCDRYAIRQVQHGGSISSSNLPALSPRRNYDQVAPEWDREVVNVREDMDVYAIYFVNKFKVTFIGEDGYTFVAEFAVGDTYTPKALINDLGLSLMYQIVYDDFVMPDKSVMEDMVVHYHILDRSIYVVYGILAVLAMIAVYFIISFVHYNTYLKKRWKSKSS